MYLKPHIYHISFDIKDTKTDDEYKAISGAIQSFFDKYRSDNPSNNCCIDILESSLLLYTKLTEEEIKNKLKNAITNEGESIEHFWCFICSVNDKFAHECLTEEMISVFNRWIQNAAGF